MVARHDISGGVAQHLMLAKEAEVPCLAVVNGIVYDSRVPRVLASEIRPWPLRRPGKMFSPRVACPS
jgi:hypothetical protein